MVKKQQQKKEGRNQQQKLSSSDIFRKRVLAAVASIKEGEVRTYKDIAIRAGNPNASRAVGAIMRSNFNPDIPCHRVVCSNGALGGYNRGVKRKRALLKREGVLR